MFQAQEQVVEVKEEQVEIVELSEADLQWIGGGSGTLEGSY